MRYNIADRWNKGCPAKDTSREDCATASGVGNIAKNEKADRTLFFGLVFRRKHHRLDNTLVNAVEQQTWATCIGSGFAFPIRRCDCSSAKIMDNSLPEESEAFVGLMACLPSLPA